MGGETLFESATASWLDGPEATWAERPCSQEDVDGDGQPEGNTCIASTPDELEFPDDWCDRCYTLFVTRKAQEERIEMVHALLWIQEFAAKTNEVGIVHTGFTHVERMARAALEAQRRAAEEPTSQPPA